MAVTLKFEGVSRRPDGTRLGSQKVLVFKTSDNSLIGQAVTDAEYGDFEIIAPSVDEAYVVCLFDDETITPRIFSAVDPFSYGT